MDIYIFELSGLVNPCHATHEYYFCASYNVRYMIGVVIALLKAIMLELYDLVSHWKIQITFLNVEMNVESGGCIKLLNGFP